MASPASTPPAYGSVATQYGVVWEVDGRFARIEVPQVNSIGPVDGGFFESKLMRSVIALFSTKHFHFGRHPRAVIQIDDRQLTVKESPDGLNTFMRSWPRSEIAELRNNRYSPGILLRIAGKVNTDLLCDLPPDLLKWIGQVLDAALHHPGIETS